MKWAEVEDRFFVNLRARMSALGLSSRQLSLKMGRNEFYIATLLKGGSRLRVDTLLDLAEALHIDPMALLWGDAGGGGEAVPQLHSPAAAANEKAAKLLAEALHLLGGEQPSAPRFEDVLSWWRESEGRLVNCAHILEHCDLHQAPDGALPRTTVRWIGEKSLAARVLGAPDVDKLHQEMDKAIPEDSQRVTESYLSALQGAPVLSCESLRGRLTSDATLRLDYDRLLLPVVDQNGERLVLNYSKEVGPV